MGYNAPFISKYYALGAFILIALLISSCGVLKWSEIPESPTSEHSIPSATNPPKNSTEEPKKPSSPSSSNTVKAPPRISKNLADRQKALLNVYSEWKGTPYRLGGVSKSGIDCSAFVQVAMADAFNTKTSRTTSTQRTEGEAIKKSELQTGDLVFFQTGKSTWHVGIYLSNMQFMHASVTYGVSVSDLSNAYWKRRYKYARRVLR